MDFAGGLLCDWSITAPLERTELSRPGFSRMRVKGAIR